MALIDGIVGPIAGLLDKIIPDPKAREAAKLELLRLEGTQEMERVRTQMAAVLAEAERYGALGEAEADAVLGTLRTPEPFRAKIGHLRALAGA